MRASPQEERVGLWAPLKERKGRRERERSEFEDKEKKKVGEVGRDWRLTPVLMRRRRLDR